MNNPDSILKEKDYKESENFFRLITENANDLIRVLNDKLIIEYINEPAHKKVIGYSKEDLIGNNALKLIHPEETTSIRRYMIKVNKNGEATREGRIKHKNGNWIWFELKGKKLIDEKNQVKYLFVSRNINERKKAEEKLRQSEEKFRKLNLDLTQKIQERTIKLSESEEKFRTIAEQTIFGIVILQDGKIKYTNKAIEAITGFPQEEVLNWSRTKFARQIHPDDLAFTMKQMEKKFNLEPDTVSQYNLRIISKTKEIRWVELYSKVIFYDRKLADLITLYDINDKKEAEQLLKESEEKFRTIADQSLLGIAIVQNGYTKYANKALSGISEYTIEEMKTMKRNAFMKTIHPDDLNFVWNEIQKNVASSAEQKSQYTLRIITKYKKVKWVDYFTKTILYKGGTAQLIMFIDITDEKEAELKLKQSEEKLKQQNIELMKLDQMKNDFITIAAHELKTPLVPITGYVELILSQFSALDSEIVDNLLRVQGNAERLRLYIDELINVMKIDADKIDIIKSKGDICTLIKSCISELELEMENKELNIKLDLPDNLEANYDPNHIRKVINNIFVNAIKFTPQKGKIIVSAIEKEDCVSIKTKDSGIGLSKEDMDRLFEKFIRLNLDPEQYSKIERGSGLGLYISKGIVEAHGGKIWVESEGVNTGSEFVFTLPKK